MYHLNNHAVSGSCMVACGRPDSNGFQLFSNRTSLPLLKEPILEVEAPTFCYIRCKEEIC